MSKLYFEVVGDVTFAIEITEIAASLIFDVRVHGDTGTAADLQGLKFNLNNPLLREGLDVTGLNTDVKKDAVPFDAKLLRSHDVMLSFAHEERLVDDQTSLAFKLSHSTADLSIDAIFDQPFVTCLAKDDRKVPLMAGLSNMFQPSKPEEPSVQAA